MARLNNSLKFILMNVNIIFATIGLLLFALSLYLFFGNFGELDKELFIGIGLVLTFTGLSVMLASCLGCQGAVNQNEKFGKATPHGHVQYCGVKTDLMYFPAFYQVISGRGER